MIIRSMRTVKLVVRLVKNIIMVVIVRPRSGAGQVRFGFRPGQVQVRASFRPDPDLFQILVRSGPVWPGPGQVLV